MERLLNLATKIGKRESDITYPHWAVNGGQRALVDFGFADLDIAVLVDETILREKEHHWVGNRMRERALARALHQVLPDGFDRFDELFDLLKARDEYR